MGVGFNFFNMRLFDEQIALFQFLSPQKFLLVFAVVL
jgi:hypothetical protein